MKLLIARFHAKAYIATRIAYCAPGKLNTMVAEKIGYG